MLSSVVHQFVNISTELAIVKVERNNCVENELYRQISGMNRLVTL